MPLVAPSIVQIGYARNDGPNAGFNISLPSTPTPGNTMIALASGSGNGILNALAFGGWNYLGDGGNPYGYYGVSWYRVVQAGDGTIYGFYIGGDGDVYTAVQNLAVIEITGAPTLHYYNGTANATPSITGTMSSSPVAPNPGLIMMMFTWDLQGAGSGFGPGSYTLQHQFGDTTHTGSPANYAYGALVTGSGSPPAEPVVGTATWGQQPLFAAVTAGPVNIPTVTVLSNNNPSIVGQSVQFTINVTGSAGTPTGSVTLHDSIGDFPDQVLPLSGGSAMYSTSAMSVNSHVITANYSGNGTYTPYSGFLTQTVNNKVVPTVQVLSSFNPSVVGHSVMFTVNVTGSSGTPTGNVTLHDSIGDFPDQILPLISGSANYSTSAMSINAHTISAAYGGDGTYAIASGDIVQNVEPRFTPNIAIVGSLDPSMSGNSITLTINVTSPASPTGDITITDSVSGNLGTFALVSGSFTYGPVSNFSVASHLITVSYAGDSDNMPGSSTLIQLVLTSRGTSLVDVPGFSILADFSSQGDTSLPSWASFSAVPTTAAAHTPIYILWTSNNVVAVGIGPPVNILVDTTGSGTYEIVGGFATTTTLACTGYDSEGHIVATQNVEVTIT